jgi:hypothetical protein
MLPHLQTTVGLGGTAYIMSLLPSPSLAKKVTIYDVFSVRSGLRYVRIKLSMKFDKNGDCIVSSGMLE